MATTTPTTDLNGSQVPSSKAFHQASSMSSDVNFSVSLALHCFGIPPPTVPPRSLISSYLSFHSLFYREFSQHLVPKGRGGRDGGGSPTRQSNRERLQTPKALYLVFRALEFSTDYYYCVSMHSPLKGSFSNYSSVMPSYTSPSCDSTLSSSGTWYMSLGTKLIADGYLGKPALEINHVVACCYTFGAFGVLRTNLLDSETSFGRRTTRSSVTDDLS